MRKAQLLLVEDDDEFAGLLAKYLRPEGFELARVATGDVGAERILAEQPDLVILDLMLPGTNGLDVVRRVREGYAGAILMLTASQSEADHVAGLELGADDFVIKPIEPRVLLARIRSQLRRNGGTRPAEDQDRIHVGPIHIDVSTRDVRIDDAPVSLTSMEFDVLRMLAAQAGSVVARDDLYTRLLGIEYDGLDRGMDVHVSRLRRKLERAGLDRSRIKSVRGVGYLLACR